MESEDKNDNENYDNRPRKKARTSEKEVQAEQSTEDDGNLENRQLRLSQVVKLFNSGGDLNGLGMSSDGLTTWSGQGEETMDINRSVDSNRFQSPQDGQETVKPEPPMSPADADPNHISLPGLGFSQSLNQSADGFELRNSTFINYIKSGLDVPYLGDSSGNNPTGTTTTVTEGQAQGQGQGDLPIQQPDLRAPMGAGTKSPTATIPIPQQQPQGQQQGNSPEGMITTYHNLDATVDNQLKALKFRQRRALEMVPLGQQPVEELIDQQDQLGKTIREAMKTLDTIYENNVLTSSSGYVLITTLDNFKFHAKQLQILQEELQNARSGIPLKPHAALIVSKQPFPCTVKQMKSLDEAVEVKLITGAKTDITGVGIVRAEMINEDYNPVPKKKNTQPSVQNAEESIKDTGVAIFKKLTFPHGSRVKSVNMKFGAEVSLNGQTQRLQSDATRPFIVMTNHGQRSITEGKLLKKSTFFGRSEIPWPLFANTLQLHYLRATGQEPMKPVRPLSLKDINYLHMTKFSGRPVITQEDYDEFWKWFGKILYKIRNHQKHILPMWTKGLIYGFLSREESDTILKGANPHSFLIRFSDRRPGHFVVVYVNQVGESNTEIKHYLVRKEDIDNKTTLPDFLRECENLWYILQLVRDPDTGVASLRSRTKDKALSPFYTRRPSVQLPFGYDNRQP